MTFAFTKSSNVPSPFWTAFAESISFAPALATESVNSETNALKLSFLATKSVSQFTSTKTPDLASTSIWAATTPSLASRSAFFAALIAPRSLRNLIAASTSPLVSLSAFLHSIIPALVLSLSSLTKAAVISAIVIN